MLNNLPKVIQLGVTVCFETRQSASRVHTLNLYAVTQTAFPRENYL